MILPHVVLASLAKASAEVAGLAMRDSELASA